MLRAFAHPFLLAILALTPSSATGAEKVHKAPRGVTHVANLEYARPDSKTSLRLDLARPAGVKELRPVVVVVHGGGWVMGNRASSLPLVFKLAQAGYVAVTIDYRLLPKHRFPAQYDDLKDAVRWLRKNAAKYGIDGKRVGVVGYSAGGHLACLLGTKGHTDKGVTVQAVVSCYGVTDLEALYHTYQQSDRSILEKLACQSIMGKLLGGSPTKVPARYRDASPIKHVGPRSAPTLLVHGADDRMVPADQSRAMAARLKAAKVEAKLLVIPKGEHGFGNGDGGAVGVKADVATLAFLDRHLKQSVKVAALKNSK